MIRPLALALALAGCGAATDGSALVHGTVFAGKQPWETSLERLAPAEVHGALPFRVVIRLTEEPRATGRDGLPAGLTLELRSNRTPPDGEAVAIGGEEGPRATLLRVPAGEPDPELIEDLGDRRWSDGGFALQAVDGSLTVDFDGRGPGDGARGTFSLTFRTGENVHGTFAAALAD